MKCSHLLGLKVLDDLDSRGWGWDLSAGASLVYLAKRGKEKAGCRSRLNGRLALMPEEILTHCAFDMIDTGALEMTK